MHTPAAEEGGQATMLPRARAATSLLVRTRLTPEVLQEPITFNNESHEAAEKQQHDIPLSIFSPAAQYLTAATKTYAA